MRSARSTRCRRAPRFPDEERLMNHVVMEKEPRHLRWPVGNTPSFLAAALLGAGVLISACSAADGKTKDTDGTSAPPRISVSPTAAVTQPIARYIRATGTLMAE